MFHPIDITVVLVRQLVEGYIQYIVCAEAHDGDWRDPVLIHNSL
jgi:hypothetical protein